jgi:hypothetical protein
MSDPSSRDPAHLGSEETPHDDAAGDDTEQEPTGEKQAEDNRDVEPPA